MRDPLERVGEPGAVAGLDQEPVALLLDDVSGSPLRASRRRRARGGTPPSPRAAGLPRPTGSTSARASIQRGGEAGRSAGRPTPPQIARRGSRPPRPADPADEVQPGLRQASARPAPGGRERVDVLVPLEHADEQRRAAPRARGTGGVRRTDEVGVRRGTPRPARPSARTSPAVNPKRPGGRRRGGRPSPRDGRRAAPTGRGRASRRGASRCASRRAPRRRASPASASRVRASVDRDRLDGLWRRRRRAGSARSSRATRERQRARRSAARRDGGGGTSWKRGSAPVPLASTRTSIRSAARPTCAQALGRAAGGSGPADEEDARLHGRLAARRGSARAGRRPPRARSSATEGAAAREACAQLFVGEEAPDRRSERGDVAGLDEQAVLAVRARPRRHPGLASRSRACRPRAPRRPCAGSSPTPRRAATRRPRGRARARRARKRPEEARVRRAARAPPGRGRRRRSRARRRRAARPRSRRRATSARSAGRRRRASGREAELAAQLLSRPQLGQRRRRVRKHRRAARGGTPQPSASSRRYADGSHDVRRAGGRRRRAQAAAAGVPGPAARWNSSSEPRQSPQRRARSNAGSAVSFTTNGVRASERAERRAAEHAGRVDDVGPPRTGGNEPHALDVADAGRQRARRPSARRRPPARAARRP